jgi:hypothetical protein
MYALVAIIVVLVVGGFFIVRFIRRHKPSLLPRLRGKGKGAKGRLGLTGVELLPTSMISISTPHIGMFPGSSNVGKDNSRSSSLEMLPTFTPHPPSAFTIRSSRNPFMFNDRSYPHRRSKSLSVPTRHLAGSSPHSTSSPATPSPLVDFSTSNSSSSSVGVSASKDTSHRFSPDTVIGPLIPIPMPVPSPKRLSISKPTSTSNVWAYDFEDEEEDPLNVAFKRSQPHSTSSPLPTPTLLPSSQNAHLQPPTPSTAGFPLTPPPPGLSFNRLDMAIEIVSIMPPPVDAGMQDLASAPVFPLPFSASMWNGELKVEDMKLVDLDDGEEHTPQSMAGIGVKTFVNIDQELLVDAIPVHEAEEGVVDQEEAVHASAHVQEVNAVPLVAYTDVAQEDVAVQPEVEQDEVEHDTYMDNHKDWQDWHTEQPSHMDDNESEDEESLSPASSSPSSPSPQYSPPLGMLHTSPLPISGTNLVDISRSPSPVDMGEPFQAVIVVPPSARASWSSEIAANEDDAEDAWGFETRMGIGMENVEESSMEARDREDLIQFDGSGSEGARDVAADAEEDDGDFVHGDVDVGEPAATDEAWAEEPTVVWNDMNGVVEVEDDVVGKDSAENILRTVYVEKNIQVMEPVFEEKPVFEEEEIVRPAKIDLAKETHVEHDQGPAKALEEDNDINNINDLHDVSPTPVLEPLSIPPITSNQQEEEELPDPDLLPLPISRSPSLSLSSQKPSAPSIKIPSQIPTPPPSLPTSGSHLDTRSDFSGLTTPTSTPASPFKLNTPIVVGSLSSPISSAPTANSATSMHPAWSLRAADAPALGLAAPSANVGLRPRSSPDMRMRMKVLGDVTENEKTVERDSIELAMKDDISDKEEKWHDLTLPAPIKLSTSLPGSFPSESLDPTTEPPLSSPSTLRSPSATQPNPVPVATSNTPLVQVPRRTLRSPLDIALAMQLRPGLGLGADPAWMVRFLMSMFGWFAILISGRGDFDAYMYAG